MYIYLITVTGDDHSKQEPTKTQSALTLDRTVDTLTVTRHMPDKKFLVAVESKKRQHKYESIKITI